MYIWKLYEIETDIQRSFLKTFDLNNSYTERVILFSRMLYIMFLCLVFELKMTLNESLEHAVRNDSRIFRPTVSVTYLLCPEVSRTTPYLISPLSNKLMHAIKIDNVFIIESLNARAKRLHLLLVKKSSVLR